MCKKSYTLLSNYIYSCEYQQKEKKKPKLYPNIKIEPTYL